MIAMNSDCYFPALQAYGRPRPSGTPPNLLGYGRRRIDLELLRASFSR